VLPLRDGLALRPKSPGSVVRAIELSGGTIAVDGVPVTGAELRDRIGPDADLIIRLSYLDAVARDRLFAAPLPPSTTQAPDAGPERARPRPQRSRRGDRIRFGGDVTVLADETIDGTVAAFGGSADIQGEVLGEVVALGGDVVLGPESVVSEDVVVVGGTVRRDQAARVRGEIRALALLVVGAVVDGIRLCADGHAHPYGRARAARGARRPDRA
jgi:hypothetical protein